MAAMLRTAARAASTARSAAPGSCRLLSTFPTYSEPVPREGAVRVDFDVPYELHKLEEAPAMFTYVTREELLDYYTTMYKMRRMEISADTLYKGKYVKGFCHLYDGQEAICVGMEGACTVKDASGKLTNALTGTDSLDSIVTSYRDHCQQLARGDTVEGVLSELLGKYQGCAKGKGGSMHMYKADSNFFGGNGIVGAQSPIGAGLAFAHKYKGDGSVAFTLFGDGAANQGQLYEAMNMSALWKLPVIYVCENNQYGMGTAKGRSSANSDYYTRGHYIPGIKADGMNVLIVREVTKFVKHYALNHGPIVLELDTYRYHGHSMSDPGITYRTRDEVSSIRKLRDPVDASKRLLLDMELASAAEIKEIEVAVRAEVNDAVEAAKAAPQPPQHELYEDIYVNQTKEFFMRGCDMSASRGVYGTTK